MWGTQSGNADETCWGTGKAEKEIQSTTDSKHNMPVSPNLLKREFNVLQQDRAWVGDITYIWTISVPLLRGLSELIDQSAHP